MDNNNLPKTEKDLETWMKNNCYNFSGYSINGNIICEGYGMDRSGGLFIWYYTERGEKKNLKYFPSEAEITEYAFDQLKADKWAKTHCIGFTTSISEKQELETLLKELNIDFFQDKIPYEREKPAYRTFVLGCDICKTEHLKENYYQRQ